MIKVNKNLHNTFDLFNFGNCLTKSNPHEPQNRRTAEPQNHRTYLRLLKFFGILIISFIIFACNKDPIPDISPENKTNNIAGRPSGNIILANYENGRLVFENQSDFDQTIANLKDKDETELRNVFGDYYKLGFIPLYPYYKETETKKIIDFLQKKKDLLPIKFKGKELEFDDNLISDDLFASLLNYEREIVLGGKLIKYTYSGALIVEEKDSLALRKYVKNNTINNYVPDPLTLQTGLHSLTSEIDVYVSKAIAPQAQPCLSPPNTYGPNPIGDIWCGGGGGPWGGSNPPSPDTNYTDDLIDYIKDLEPCNYENAGWWGMTPFETRKVCYEEFSNGKRRTKTLYSNEDYWIYTSIQVKIKHQRYHHIDVFDTTILSWWASKVTDEVSLAINEAVFRISPSNMTAPPPPGLDMSIAVIETGNMVFCSQGKVIDPTATGPEIYSWSVPTNEYPSTPFNEEVIVQYFNQNISFSSDMDTTVDQVTNLFWNSVFELAVAAGNMVDSDGETTRITMLLSSPTSTIVHHVDLSRRVLDTKKIKYVLGEDWGASISFNISLNGNGEVITDPEMIGTHTGIDISVGVEAGNLTEFDDIYMNFTGVSRRNSEWRGDNMVYKALNLN